MQLKNSSRREARVHGRCCDVAPGVRHRARMAAIIGSALSADAAEELARLAQASRPERAPERVAQIAAASATDRDYARADHSDGGAACVQ